MAFYLLFIRKFFRFSKMILNLPMGKMEITTMIAQSRITKTIVQSDRLDKQMVNLMK